VLESLPWSLHLTKAVMIEFQGATPHLAFLLQLSLLPVTEQWRKMSAVVGSMG
jgi:hypothetical protein